MTETLVLERIIQVARTGGPIIAQQPNSIGACAIISYDEKEPNETDKCGTAGTILRKPM